MRQGVTARAQVGRHRSLVRDRIVQLFYRELDNDKDVNRAFGGFILLPKGPGSMPKEEARNKRGGPEHPHECGTTPYRPIVVMVGLFL
jgi:hypothetical protein